MVPLEHIERYARTIGEDFKAERVILFGSYAYGEPDEDSDVDLLVVMPHEEQGWRKAAEIRLAHSPQFPCDMLVRSPEEFQERIQLGDCFMQEIAEKGRLVYETAH